AQRNREHASVPKCEARADRETEALHWLGIGPQTISRAAVRVDEWRRAAVVHFAAQPVDVDLERVGERIVILVPDVLAQLRAAHHSSGVARKILEKSVLLHRDR